VNTSTSLEFNELCEQLNGAISEAEKALSALGIRVRASVPLDEEASLCFMKTEGSWGLCIFDAEGHCLAARSSIERRILAIYALPAMKLALEEAYATRMAEMRDAIAVAKRFVEEHR
jgi:hypothetical protein